MGILLENLGVVGDSEVGMLMNCPLVSMKVVQENCLTPGRFRQNQSLQGGES